MLEEHIFLEEEDILISSTRIVISEKVIAASQICSVDIDREEIKPPLITLGIGSLGIFAGVTSPNYLVNEFGLLIGSAIIILGLAYWLNKSSKRKEAVIIELSSRSKEYIDTTQVEDIEKVYKAINDLIIFRG